MTFPRRSRTRTRLISNDLLRRLLHLSLFEVHASSCRFEGQHSGRNGIRLASLDSLDLAFLGDGSDGDLQSLLSRESVALSCLTLLLGHLSRRGDLTGELGFDEGFLGLQLLLQVLERNRFAPDERLILKLDPRLGHSSTRTTLRSDETLAADP